MAARSGRNAGQGRARRVEALREGEAQNAIDAALALIASEGWRGLSLAAIAAEAGLSLVSLYRAFGSKTAILAAFSRGIDEKVLAERVTGEAEERPRERLFDCLMRRFDALKPYRPALEVLARELPADPPAALCLAAGLLRSMRWMLEASGIAASGLGGALRIKLTAAAYLAALRVFLRDDSADLGRTMAALDRSLRRLEWALSPARKPRAAAAPTSA